MPYEITATKFRPQNFNELVGQEFVAATLSNSIQTKKIANAYLLSGPRGCGKTSTARIIAKALNCQTGPTATPCNQCDTCKSITSGSNSDVIEIDGASNTSINDVRIIQEEIQYPPMHSLYKVYIIDEVHMLSKSAFNALLKTIEEPPPQVVFIFATTEVNKVLPTIRSRCQQFNLRLIPSDQIFNSLIKVLKSNNIKFEEDAVKWVANEGKGSMRDAYTLLDQVISFCDDNITYEKIQEKLGFIGEEKICNIVKHIISGNRQEIFKEYYNILESGVSPDQLIVELIKFFRNLLLKKTNINSSKLILDNPKINLTELSAKFEFEDIENIMDLLFGYYEKSRYSVDIQTETEICLLKLLKYKDLIRPKQILSQIEQLKQSILSGDPGKIQDIPVKVVQKVLHDDNPNINVEANKSDILKILISKVPQSNFSLTTALNNVLSIEEAGNSITLYFSRQIYFDTAFTQKDLLSGIASSIIGKQFSISVKMKEETLESKNIASENVRKVKEIFNGVDL